MKTLKVVLGNICLQAALIISVVVLFNFRFPTDLPLIFSSCWLAGIGWFLVVRRNVPMSSRARTWAVLHLGFCVGFLILVGIPHFIKARSTHAYNPCINNLRQIDAAANEFALEHNLSNGATIKFPDDLTPYIKLNRAGKIPFCPEGGIYHLSRVGEPPTCSLGATVTPAHILP